MIRFLKVNKLSDVVVEKIKKTVFGHFWDIPLCKIINSDLDVLISKYLGENYFLLGGERCNFYVDNIVEILQIPNEDSTSRLERLFEGKTHVRKSDVERILKQLARTRSSEDEDVCVKLWICLLFTTFLIPDSSCGFPSWMLRYLDDFDRISSYN